ncbi:filamentation induced by cAMP protein Fic [Dyadobacter fermentans DSM 18053]|uniref:Filamentation induced by cAMP protein Fic n=2 Tax=Dyadobacter fermentans TaxID=94254 RepID=C6W3M6_DYAFD|nr:filamentation induced by cAMP protein Fic [Dyadobacter fermentans DSM 18053]
MNIMSDLLLDDYRKQLGTDLHTAWQQLRETFVRADSFDFYTSVAVITSSKIEGEPMDVDSYIKHKIQQIEYLPELTQKPNDLFRAYIYAKENRLSQEHFAQAHRMITEHLLPAHWRGVYRRGAMVVMEHKTGRIQFEAAPAHLLETEMRKLWDDIGELLSRDLSLEETFYYASFIHLLFVCIHPFNDGNGRAGRLLEKWFLSDKLGAAAWHVQSEQHYYRHVDAYYRNLNKMGLFYEELDFTKAEPFLGMLPDALNN